MSSRWPCIVPAMVCCLLAACTVIGPTDVGYSYDVYRNVKGQEVLTNLACGDAIDPCNESMHSATVTNNPTDEEFWRFNNLPKKAELTPGAIVAVIILAPVWVPEVLGQLLAAPILALRGERKIINYTNVMGSQETCDTVRATATNPTEACEGPFYFRRDDR